MSCMHGIMVAAPPVVSPSAERVFVRLSRHTDLPFGRRPRDACGGDDARMTRAVYQRRGTSRYRTRFRYSV